MIQFLWESIQWAFSDNLKTAIATAILTILFFPVRERITRWYGASFTLRHKKWVIRRLKRLTADLEMVRRGVVHLEVLRHIATIAAFSGVITLAAVGSGSQSETMWWFTPHLVISFAIACSVYSLSSAFKLIRVGLYPRSEISSFARQLDRKRRDELTDRERQVILKYLDELRDLFPDDQPIENAIENFDDIKLYLKSAHSIEAEAKFKERMHSRSKDIMSGDEQG
ncbi:hypothetical protein G6L97_03275 [Agrobacterium tumefaciens]|uniref:hypothetical protein n=1 Tax=Agrobacterium tumefaciens TaxID=358 RepID=UPI001572F3A0|nr:hypothetical protein [Agrobacterium tumefaciens]NSZ83432.1 hypothetical protein [Agrobacterium tumefaciens]WCA69643.1 hypothetical protein G6L97_03275 [Agrobacterium tumefaciens]